MLAERKARPQPIVSEIPPYKPNASKVAGNVPNREHRDANAPASPQPQQNSRHQYPPHHLPEVPQKHTSTFTQQQQQQPQQQQQQQSQQQLSQQKASSNRTRRGSVDRGTKDSLKARSLTPKAAFEHVGPYLLGKTLGKGSSGTILFPSCLSSPSLFFFFVVSPSTLPTTCIVVIRTLHSSKMPEKRV